MKPRAFMHPTSPALQTLITHHILTLSPISMAQNKLIVAFFLLSMILLLAHQTQSRELKFNNKNARMKLTNNCLSAMPCSNEAAFTPKTATPPPPPPPTAVATSQPPPAGHADDFRPTAPGHSPGIGHSV